MISSGLVNVFTRDIERALAFYQGTLGLDVETGRPCMSLAFWVDDVDATFDVLTAAGAPVVSAPHDADNDNRNAAVRDPDGTLVEIVAKR